MQPVSGIRLFKVRLGIVIAAVYWCFIFTGTHLPKIPASVPRINDKVMHFTAFYVLATILCYCTTSEKLVRRFGTIVAVCLLYGLLDEWTQSFVRGRTTDLYDFAADACGTISAVAIYMSGRYLWKRRQKRQVAMVSQ